MKKFSLKSLVLGSMFYTPKVAAVQPVHGATMSAMGATALRQQAWDKYLREDNTLDDIFDRLAMSVDVRMTDIEVPNTIFMQFETPATSNHKLTFAMSTPFKKAFQMGTDEDMLGNEEDFDLLHLTIRYNEIKKAAAYPRRYPSGTPF
jgi:hypothetical protein